MMVTIVGTARDDQLGGTEGADVIWAGPGNDRVEGHGGDDVICMGDADDPVAPLLDSDQVNTAIGGPGDDRIVGSPAGNSLWGDGGDDEIWAAPDPSLGDYWLDPRAIYLDATYRGGPGNDVIHGRAGADKSSGGNGVDILEGMGDVKWW